jgi:hypothetical protein
MEPITGWDDFASTSPAVAALTTPASGYVVTPLGFIINEYGHPMPTQSASDESIERFRREFGRPDWLPVLTQDVLPGIFTVTDFSLSVHDVTIVDFEVGGSSRALFRIAKDFIYGSAYKGLGAQWRDGTFGLRALDGSARLWRWPLRDIASVEVVRTHKTFKLRDEEVLIRGEAPGPEAKGEGAGVSVMRFGGLEAKEAANPSDGSPFLGFGEHLAKLIAAARGTSAIWRVEANGKDKTHVASFA